MLRARRVHVKMECSRLTQTALAYVPPPCSARAAEMQGSILVSELSAVCLRLWTEQVAWRGLDKLAIHSLVVAPVCASPQVVFGTIVVWRQQPASALCGEDRLFVEEVARRLAGADLSIN